MSGALAHDVAVMKDDGESAPFDPMVILPSQLAVDACWASEASGPIGLMLAVVEEAVRCIALGRRRRRPGIRMAAAEAEAWMRSDSRDWPFAFASICDVLGIDIDAARAHLLRDDACQPDRTRQAVRHIARGAGRASLHRSRSVRRAA